MATVGVVVTATEIPGGSVNPFNTANAFIIGLGDWGAPSGVNTPVAAHSLTDVANTIGPRTTTNATLFDSLDVFFREGGSTAYIGRVVGPNPTSASLVLQDNSSATSVTLTAAYVGNYGNAIQAAVTNNSTNVVVTLTDTFGNTLAISPALTTIAAVAAWATTTGYVTGVAGGGGLPKTLVATSLTGGSDNRGSATLTSWQNALNTFNTSFGPGQVLAPGQTQATLAGIWAALGQHALNNNRVALCDMDDGTTAATAIAAVSTTYNSTGVGPIGFWAGNLTIPGVVPSTTRSVPPSPVVAALCARADTGGNPNLAAAGSGFPLQYVTGSATLVSGNQATYSFNDLQTLNAAGINTFQNRLGQFENYGFVGSILPGTDAIYWQFNHQRCRMALQANAQIVGEPFVFGQLDGQGGTTSAFGAALAGMLNAYYQIGALYGANATDAYQVNVGPTINTTASLQAGQLNAIASVRLSPFAELVSIVLNAVPITQTVPVAA